MTKILATFVVSRVKFNPPLHDKIVETRTEMVVANMDGDIMVYDAEVNTTTGGVQWTRQISLPVAAPAEIRTRVGAA